MGEDYKLLENMNNMTRERYGELAVVAQELMQEVGKLQTTCKWNGNFSPSIHRPCNHTMQHVYSHSRPVITPFFNQLLSHHHHHLLAKIPHF